MFFIDKGGINGEYRQKGRIYLESCFKIVFPTSDFDVNSTSRVFSRYVSSNLISAFGSKFPPFSGHSKKQIDCPSQ